MLGLAGHRDEVLVHLLGAVGVAGGLLHRGAAAEVEVPAGHRRGAAGRGRAFEHQHPRPGRRGADRRASAGDAEADDHDVDLVGPVRHVGGVDGFRDLGASLLLLFDVVEERPDFGRDVGDLDVGHAGLRGGDVGEPHTAGHHALLDDRGSALLGVRQCGVEGLGVVGLDADVVQSRPAAVQELGVDALAASPER